MKNIKLNFAFLCDYASLDNVGKLNIMGIFKNIIGRQLPIVQPQMFVVTNLSVEKGSDYKEIIKIVDEDNREVAPPIEFNFSVASDDSTVNPEAGFIGQLNGIRFEKEGVHNLKVYVDEKLVGNIPFEVKIL